jgi:copper(I)-binding protein
MTVTLFGRALLGAALLFPAPLLAGPADVVKLAPAANHHAAPSGALQFSAAFARPSYGQTKVGAGFVTIHNATDTPDSLLEVTTPAAEAVEMHTTVTIGDTLRMQKIDEIPLPAHSTVSLAPGGMHLMFFRLAEPFKEGMEFPITLKFSSGAEQQLTLKVTAR